MLSRVGASGKSGAVQTEAGLANADRLWRNEMTRRYGPDGVLLYGYEKERRGALGSCLRQTFEARRDAVSAWRYERRPAVRN
ncbi:hypothetical protein FV217_10945 [Methylobacterium sp. WL9]|nr:hypothetical protein FV217_10945 [Methylobacterium sp. WL9]